MPDAILQSSEERKKPGLWSLVGHAVGKDISRICLPVAFNEPLSMLQRISEDLECVIREICQR